MSSNPSTASRLSISKEAVDILSNELAAIGITTITRPCFHDLLSFMDLLYEWNKNVNLTSIVGVEGIVTHLVDSLSILRLKSFTPEGSLVDIGSGAGLPGIPLGLTFPQLQITLVESIAKKVTFQQYAVEELDLKNVIAKQGRAEVLSRDKPYKNSFDFAAARAVGSLDALCKWAKPFLKPSGVLIAYKGKAEAIDAVPNGWQKVEEDHFLLREKNRTLLVLKADS